jgi:LacI family transcriptional regulator, repressor for deo operon, udp, cdd, tsx, nupC, and nupG
MRMAFLRKGQESGETPTIYDVARECGVSPSTVSRAFSRPGRVSPATAERIKAAAERLGYRTNPIARALVAGRTAMIAVVVSDITNPVYFPVIRGAEQEASAAGFSMLLCDTRESARTERADIDRTLPIVEGLVLASSRMSDATIRTIAGRTPLVVLNRAVPAVPSVVTDNPRGMRRAVEHLGELGHTAITYVAGPEASWANGIRWRAVQEGAHELELRARRIGPFSPTVLGGLAAANELMNNPSTAVIAYNDLLAIGVLRGLARAGVVVPAQISVVGFDNIFGSDFCTPSLTTVAAPLHALGATAVKQLLAQINGGRPHPAEAGVLPAQLMVRESTAPPPRSPVA